MHKKYTGYEAKGANQKATDARSTSSAGAGAHLHAIYIGLLTVTTPGPRLGVHHFLTFCDCFFFSFVDDGSPNQLRI